MIGFLKRLLGKKERDVSFPDKVKTVVGGEKASPSHPLAHAGTYRVPITAPEIEQPSVPPAGIQDKNFITLSLKTIILGLPENLRKAVVKLPGSDVLVKFSTGRILPQLSTGAVKITLRELKNASPTGIFISDSSLDNEIVYLPLEQIIPQTIPFLKKKPDQKFLEISEEIPDVFGPKGRLITEDKVPTKEHRKVARVEEKEMSIPGAGSPEKVTSLPMEREGGSVKLGEGVKESVKVQAPITTPLVSQPVGGENYLSIEIKSVATGWEESIRKKFEEFKVLERKLYIPINELEPQMKRGKIVFSWRQLSAWIIPSPPPEFLDPNTNLELPIAMIAPIFLQRLKRNQPQKRLQVEEDIPDLFKPALGQTQSMPAAPVVTDVPKPAEVETALKSPEIKESVPKVEVKMPAIPLTIKPSPVPPKPEIKLPSTSEQVLPKRETKPAEVSTVVSKQEGLKPKSLGEVFGKPDKPMWSPNEVIQNTLSLPGVTGAMIVLKDGLPVVSKLPPGIKPEALAGFIPEMFNKVSQYTDDLKLGEIKSVSIVCEDYSVVACKSGNIYFVVTGEKDTPCPQTGILQFIADEFTKPLRK